MFALPGAVGEQNSSGTNELIKAGAKMATNAGDILTEYEAEHPELLEAYISRGGKRSASKPKRTSQPAQEERMPDKTDVSAEKAEPRDFAPHPVKIKSASGAEKNEKADKAEKFDKAGKTEKSDNPVNSVKEEKKADEGEITADLTALSDTEKQIYIYLRTAGESSSDNIISALGLSASEAMTSLTMLEIQ